MEEENVAEILKSAGVDMEVLEYYNCQPYRVRLVRDMLRIRTPYGNWGLKRIEQPAPKAEAVYLLCEHIAKTSSFRVPRFIKSRHGDAYVIHPTGIYYMVPWLPGREADLRKPQHFCEAANLLSAWHASAQGFEQIDSLPEREETIAHRLQNGYDRLSFLVRKAKQSPSPSPFERMVLASEDELIARIELANSRFVKTRVHELEALAKQSRMVCHGRFFKKNILFDGISYTVVHYEHAQCGSPLAEFAFYLHRYMPFYEWNTEILTEAIHAYDSNIPFNQTTIAQLSALIGTPFRPLQIIAWYQNREVSWEEEDFIDAYELALDLEEAREQAAMSILPITGSPSVVSLASSEAALESTDNSLLITAAAEEPTDKGTNKPPRLKKRIKKTQTKTPAGPMILTSHAQNERVDKGDVSWASDKHGSKDDEQEHEDEQV